MKVVFDMDTGVDDSLALIYALNRPAYEIQGIGCVYGNVESWLAAENTMKILDLVNAPDIPVLHAGVIPQGAQVLGHKPGKCNRTVLAACAAKGNRKLAFPLFYIKRQRKFQKLCDAAQQLLCLRKRHDITGHFLVTACFRFQLGHIKRVGQAAHIQHNVGLFRSAVFKAERHHR